MGTVTVLEINHINCHASICACVKFLNFSAIYLLETTSSLIGASSISCNDLTSLVRLCFLPPPPRIFSPLKPLILAMLSNGFPQRHELSSPPTARWCYREHCRRPCLAKDGRQLTLSFDWTSCSSPGSEYNVYPPPHTHAVLMNPIMKLVSNIN